MAKLTDQQVVDLARGELEAAMGSPGGDISNERAEAYNYYLRKPFGNEQEDLSKVVTSDVMEVVDGIMPSMMRLFTSQDNLVQFDGFDLQDEAQAEQESDYISYLFFKRNPAFEIMFFWTFDALLQKNGYVKCFWDDAERVCFERYQGLSEIELIALLEDEELEPIEREERIGEYVDETGELVTGPVYDVKFKRIQKRGKVTVENVPPDELRISNDANRLDPSTARMIAHERYVKRGTLIEMGFDKKLVNDLPAQIQSIESTETQARKDKSDDQTLGKGSGVDKSQDDILLSEVYMKVDQDGDGRAELKQIYIANGEKLEINDCDRQPFHALCGAPLPHKHIGMAVAEKVMDNQLITSTLIRQVLDNLYHTNNPGHGVWEQGIGEGTMDALLTRRVGAVTTFRRPVQESYAPMTVPFTAAESFPMLQYFDKVKRDRTGVSSDAEGLQPEALKHIQQSVLAASSDQSKMKIELVARIFAETGIKTLFLHMHELVLKHQQDAEIVKLRGQYVQVNPQEWRTRFDMTANIGLGIGTREQNLLHLETIWEKQAQMVQAGGMNLTVTPKNIYNTAAEIVKNANYKTPGVFFTDPGDKQAPPPPSEQDELQKQQMQLEARRQELDAARNEINQAKLQLQAQKQQIDAQMEMMKLQEKAQEREDKYAAENEKLRTEIVALRLENEREDRKTDAEIELIGSQAIKTRAETAQIMEATEAKGIERDMLESGLKELVDGIDEQADEDA